MQRDPGALYNMGFGATTRQGVPGDQEGVDPESGFIAKKLHGHPVMRFFAVGAATILAAAVAGEVTKKGGVKLGIKISESGSDWVKGAAHNFRDIQKTLDAWQGLHRDFADLADETKFFVKNSEGKYVGDHVDQLRGFFFTHEEESQAIRYGRDAAGETPTAWGMRQEIQQRLVSQARRLPYELPAIYVAQRAVSDKVLGQNSKPANFHWYNPADVISDFVTQGVKNTAFAIAPFEAGGAATTQSWRKLMTLGDGLTSLSPAQQAVKQITQGVGVSLKTILGQVGADAGDLVQKTIRMSSQVTGSFATGLTEAQNNSSSVVDYLQKTRHGLQAYKDSEDYKKLTRVAQKRASAVWLIQQSPFDLLNISPGPFTGLGSGLRAGAQEWKNIGGAYDEYQKFLRLGESGYAAAHPTPAEEKLLNSIRGRTGSPVQELAEAFNNITSGGPTNINWRRSVLYRGQLQDEYSKELARNLKKQGIDPATVDKFLQHASIRTPGASGYETELTKRISLGRGDIFAQDQQRFLEALTNRMNFIGPKNSAPLQRLAGALPGAMQDLDTSFQNPKFMQFLGDKIGAQYNAYEKMLPKQASNLLRPLKADYGSYTGRLTQTKWSFLRARAAQLSGISTLSDAGTPLDSALINTALAKRGLDPYNAGQLRAHLITKGAMSKPWQVGGRNIFGFKSIALSTAMERGYFNSNPDVQSTIQNISQGINKLNPELATGGFKLGGMYESSSGNIIDLARIGQGFRNFVDKFSTDFQIPLIHIKPLDLGNYRGIQGIRNRSILQYVPSRSAQPFLRGAESSDDFYMWMRSGVRGSKGRVTSVGLDAESAIRTTLLDGTYRPFPSSGEGLIPHATRLAAGEPGKAPLGDKPARQNWLRSLLGTQRLDKFRSTFSFADDDSSSIFGYLRRFRNRTGDLNNPMFFSRLMSGEEVIQRGSTYKLVGQQVLKDGAVYAEGPEIGKAMEGLQYSLRPFGFPTRGIRSLINATDTGADGQIVPKFPGLLDYHLSRTPKTFSLDAAGSVNVSTGIKTIPQYLEFANMTGEDLANLSNLPSEQRNVISRAWTSLIGRHITDAGAEGYWNVQSGLARKSSTVYSRLDEAKTDLEKFVLLRAQAVGGVDQSQFGNLINDLMAEAQKIRLTKGMTQSEFTELRTALLSLQVNYQSFASYVPTQNSLEDSMALVQRLMNANPETKKAFASFGRGEVGISKGKLGRVQPILRRHFGAAPASYEGGMTYNAFGDTRTTFVPTFGTVLSANPSKALLSASGLRTWNSPEGFSGASIPISHFIERINKPFQFLGMGLEQGDFKGPLDFYARGLIGKRMLPLLAGGATLLAADRTVGGYTNPKDQYGNRVYKPFVFGAVATGLAAGQAGIAAAIPGGMGFYDKWEQLAHGEVPIREGRYWPLGNSPIMGGRVQYFRPSWYQRFESGYQYTDQTYGSPLKRLAFDYDFSPLRPLDPYKFEREHYLDRPYPTSGDYFTGPWGPLTSGLNATVGRVLKHRKTMHGKFLNQGLAEYAPVGEGGAYFGPALGGTQGAMGGVGGGYGGGAPGAIGGGGYVSGAIGGGGGISAQNQMYAQAGAISLATASRSTKATISGVNQFYSNAANIAANGPAAYGIPSGTGMPPRIIPSGAPLKTNSIRFQAGEIGYDAQKLLGIYGFASSNIRQSLGFGNQNLVPQKPVLASASNAYGSSRSFWDLGLGGIGDVPSPFEGNFSNLELGNIFRRFVPKPRTGLQAVNPIPNAMGIQQPWLPGADYFKDFTRGDPYTQIPEGEMRLPGMGYERLHNIHPDQLGQYGLIDRFRILGDVAPWSNEYHALDRQMDSQPMDPQQRSIVETTREHVTEMAQRHVFTPYKYKYQTPTSMLDHPFKAAAGKWWEGFSHNNTYFNTKFLPVHTATEDWERDNVYGSTFPEWQHPIKDFLKPMVYTASQRNPVTASLILGTVGTFFGANPRGKTTGAAIGAIIGLGAGLFGDAYKATTGQRYIPEPRREQLALEENIDILNYVKNMHLYNEANMEGNPSAANAYRQAAQQTMYGADIYNGSLEQIALGIPERKRDHFKSMLSAPVQERSQILSTAPRLERRIYEAAWGMPVEKRPDLTDYFTKHELPGSDWEGWHANSNMDQVKVKIGQSLGIDMSEMGYYPQQLQEANLVNPSYPDFHQEQSKRNIRAQLEALIRTHDAQGYVQEIHTPFPGNRLEFHAGVS